MITISQISRRLEKFELEADHGCFVREHITNKNKYDIHFVLEADSRLIDGKVTVTYNQFPTEEQAKYNVEQLLKVGLDELDGGVHEDDR